MMIPVNDFAFERKGYHSVLLSVIILFYISGSPAKKTRFLIQNLELADKRVGAQREKGSYSQGVVLPINLQ